MITGASLDGADAANRDPRKKVELDLEQHVFLAYPRQTLLVTSRHGQDVNVATFAWSTVLSIRPPLHGLVITPRSFSNTLIQASKRFIINVPDKALIKKVVAIGGVTGREVDKFAAYGLTTLPPLALGEDGPPRIAECPAHVECVVKDVVPTGDHVLLVGEVVACSVDERLVKGDVYMPNQFEMPLHLGGREYCFNSLKKQSF